MQDDFPFKNMPTKISLPSELNPKFTFFIKREDLHLLGSHKHFGAEAQVKELLSSDEKTGVVSTSGNAGISLGYYAKNMEVNLYVLTGEKCSPGKLEAMRKNCANLYLSKNPARICNYISAKYGFKNLRPSIDDAAVKGFENLGLEIYEQFIGLKKNGKIKEFWHGIYTFVTSGASYIGMYKAFEVLHKKGAIKSMPKMNAVSGFAGRMGVKNQPRQKQIDEIMRKTGGIKIEINETELLRFKEKFRNVKLSDESLSSICAAVRSGATADSLVISTGKDWTAMRRVELASHKKERSNHYEDSRLPRLDSFEDCNKLFQRLFPQKSQK